MRINYISDSGHPKQLTRVAYGSDNAKNLEIKLINDVKNKKEMQIRKMTVQELFNEFKEVKSYEVRKSTVLKIMNVYNNFISPTFKCCYIDKITVKDCQNWKIFMENKNLSSSTKQTSFIYFNLMMNYAVKMEYIQKNPFFKIGNFKKTLNIKSKMNFYISQEFMRYITVSKKIAEEKQNLYNELSEWNYYVFFNIAFYTGLRKGEIYALKWSDIEDSFLTVSRSLFQGLKGEDIETAPKSKSSIRTLQMPLPLINILTEHKKRQQLFHNFTDNFRICNNIRDTSLYQKNKLYAKKAGVKIIRIHDFRHSHASILANSNINIQEVARRLGHSQIEMTWNIYCHLYPKEEEKAIAILNNLV